MRSLLLLPLSAIAAIALGCGEAGAGGESSGSAPPSSVAAAVTRQGGPEPGAGKPAEPSATASAKGVRLKIVDSKYGRVVANGKGEALYLFDKETTRKAECYGECTAAWPPVLTKGKPVAAAGAKSGLLGTTKRADGKLQVTYAGHPLYFYVGDSPGTILCQDVEEFGGDWLVVEPSGDPVS